jgi:hypothetical protein
MSRIQVDLAAKELYASQGAPLDLFDENFLNHVKLV